MVAVKKLILLILITSIILGSTMVQASPIGYDSSDWIWSDDFNDNQIDSIWALREGNHWDIIPESFTEDLVEINNHIELVDNSTSIPSGARFGIQLVKSVEITTNILLSIDLDYSLDQMGWFYIIGEDATGRLSWRIGVGDAWTSGTGHVWIRTFDGDSTKDPYDTGHSSIPSQVSTRLSLFWNQEESTMRFMGTDDVLFDQTYTIPNQWTKIALGFDINHDYWTTNSIINIDNFIEIHSNADYIDITTMEFTVKSDPEAKDIPRITIPISQLSVIGTLVCLSFITTIIRRKYHE